MTQQRKNEYIFYVRFYIKPIYNLKWRVVLDSKQQLVRRKNSSENMVNFATYTHADCDNVCGSIVRSDFPTWPWIITIHALPWSVVCPKLSSLIGPTTTTACIFIETIKGITDWRAKSDTTNRGSPQPRKVEKRLVGESTRQEYNIGARAGPWRGAAYCHRHHHKHGQIITT